MGAVLGLIPTDRDIDGITSVGPKRKLVVDEVKFAARISAPTHLEELFDLPDGTSFTVFSCKRGVPGRRIGFGVKTTSENGMRRLVWVRYRALLGMMRRLAPTLVESAGKHGVFHVPLPWATFDKPRSTKD
jgi:hypothetical protein